MIEYNLIYGTVEVAPGKYLPWVEQDGKRTIVATASEKDQDFCLKIAEHSATERQFRVIAQEIRELALGCEPGFLTLDSFRIGIMLADTLDALASGDEANVNAALDKLTIYVSDRKCYDSETLNLVLTLGQEL